MTFLDYDSLVWKNCNNCIGDDIKMNINKGYNGYKVTEITVRAGEKFSAIFNEAADQHWLMTENRGNLNVTREHTEGEYRISVTPENPGDFEIEFSCADGYSKPREVVKFMLHVRM